MEKMENIQKKQRKVVGSCNRCFYDLALTKLTVQGWYLPRPDRVEIWADGYKIGEAELGKERPDVTRNFPEYDDPYSGWECRIEKIAEKPEKVYSMAIYDGRCEKQDFAQKVEKAICGSVNNSYYNVLFKQLTLDGWFLPEPEQIDIYINGQKYTDVERNIERLDVYQAFRQYDNKCCGWKFERKFDNEISEAKIVLRYKEEERIIVQAIEKKEFVDKKAVNFCKYNNILQRFEIEGWCLPVPSRIEIWTDKQFLGNAHIGKSREDVYEHFPQYGEKNCGWFFSKQSCLEQIERVTVKYIWENGEIQQMDVAVTQKQYKVVSFDLFDTLVVRPVVKPTDIFKIVGIRIGNPNHFRDMRVLAEKYARKYKREDQDDIGIDEIYDRFQELYNVTDSEKEYIKTTEIQVELEYIRPRQAVKKIYERAKKSGAKVIIVTDMYLPLDAVKKILQENGYSAYDELYVSSNENAAKGTGRLYEKLIERFAKEDIYPSEILHIGDNLRADIAIAKEMGLDTFYIPKTMALFEQNKKLYSYAKNTNIKLDNRFFIGFLANKLFDDPFAEYDENTYCNGEPKNMGLVFFAPFLLEFTLWMMKNLVEGGYDTVYLAYRDGYLIEKIMILLKPWLNQDMKAIPVYLSRALRYNGYCREDNGFLRAALDYKVSPEMKLEEFVAKRLLVEEETEKEKILSIMMRKCNMERDDAVGELEQLLPALQDISAVYNRQAECNMHLIDKYCEAVFSKCEKIAVFDVGYRGAVVDFLRKLYGMEAQGYHILSYSFMEKHTAGASHTQSYIQYGIKSMNSIKILHNLMEDVISIEEGTASKLIEEDGNLKVYKEEYCIESDIVKSIQEKILETISDFLDIFGKDILNLEFDRYAEFDFICEFLIHANKKDAEILRKMQFCDPNFLGEVSKNVYQSWYDEREEG